MTKINKRPLHKDFKYIVVSVMDDKTYHFYLKDLTTVNKHSDFGYWKLKSLD